MALRYVPLLLVLLAACNDAPRAAPSSGPRPAPPPVVETLPLSSAFAAVPPQLLSAGDSLRVGPWTLYGHVVIIGLPQLGVAVTRPGEERTFPTPSPCPEFRGEAWPLEVRVLDAVVLVTPSNGVQDPSSPPVHCLLSLAPPG